MDSKNIITAKAHANIAIIKYWGKKDEAKKIPYNSSISFTLDKFYTLTSIQIDKQLTNDLFYLNGELQSVEETKKISQILDYFRMPNQFVIVKSKNSMPTAAGLSSSSSGLAALVIAANETFHTNKSIDELSYLARLGSGSACRSMYGPFAIWKTSQIDKEAIAYPLKCELDLSMIIIILNKDRKKILSRNGMKLCVDTSSIYKDWVDQANADAIKMIQYMEKNDFTNMGKLMESNTLKMHETTLYATPSFTYLTSDTHECLTYIKHLRSIGLETYYTMDAGPNVKLLCKSKDTGKIKQALLLKYDEESIVVSNAATGFEILEGDHV